MGEKKTEEKKDEKMEVDEGQKKEGEKKEEEPEFATLKNPSRILKLQEEKMSYPKGEERETRYYPILDTRFSGFVVLKDLPLNPAAEEKMEKEKFYDDEERDEDAPNPDLVS